MKVNKQVQTTPSFVVIGNSLSQIPQSAIIREPTSAKERLLEAEGGFLVSEKAAKLIGITQVELEKNRQAEKIIGLPINDGEYVYPKWQFVKKFLWGIKFYLTLTRFFPNSLPMILGFKLHSC
jgi:hypothetical protein